MAAARASAAARPEPGADRRGAHRRSVRARARRPIGAATAGGAGCLDIDLEKTRSARATRPRSAPVSSSPALDRALGEGFCAVLALEEAGVVARIEIRVRQFVANEPDPLARGARRGDVQIDRDWNVR